MPLQHISDHMLDLMKRETDGNYIRDLIKRIRAGIPDIAIRTTFIVGFPGETEGDFNELIRFIEDESFERAGIFEYSREEGTRAAKMEGHLHHMTRKSRWNEAMRAIQRNVEHVNAKLVGKTMRVLVEEPGVARSQWDAPTSTAPRRGQRCARGQLRRCDRQRNGAGMIWWRPSGVRRLT